MLRVQSSAASAVSGNVCLLCRVCRPARYRRISGASASDGPVPSPPTRTGTLRTVLVLRFQVVGIAARLPEHSTSECPDGLSKGIRLLDVGRMAAIGELDEFSRGHRGCDDLRCALQERIAVEPCDSKNRKPDTSEIIRGDDEGRLAEIGNEHRSALPVWLLGGLIEETPQVR